MKSLDIVLIPKLTQTWGNGPLMFDFHCRRRKLLPTSQDKQTLGTRDLNGLTFLHQEEDDRAEHQPGISSFLTLGWVLCSPWHTMSPQSVEAPFPRLHSCRLHPKALGPIGPLAVFHVSPRRLSDLACQYIWWPARYARIPEMMTVIMYLLLA